MAKVKPRPSATSEYHHLRRNTWMVLGFCPECLGGLDTFPMIRCSKCKYREKVNQSKRRKGA